MKINSILVSLLFLTGNYAFASEQKADSSSVVPAGAVAVDMGELEKLVEPHDAAQQMADRLSARGFPVNDVTQRALQLHLKQQFPKRSQIIDASAPVAEADSDVSTAISALSLLAGQEEHAKNTLQTTLAAQAKETSTKGKLIIAGLGICTTLIPATAYVLVSVYGKK